MFGIRSPLVLPTLKEVLEFPGRLQAAWEGKPFVVRSPQWSSVRKQYLRQYPRCAACNRTEKLEVHHIKPFNLFPELECEMTNLMTLCEWPAHNCHLVIGHGGNYAKYWNPAARWDAIDFQTMFLRHRREYAKGREGYEPSVPAVRTTLDSVE